MTAARARQGAPTSSRHRWLAAALTAAALALRLIRLGVDSLWYDETISVFLAGQPIADLIAHTARDIHPPGYYLLLRGWLTLAGYSTGQADASGFRLEFVAAFLSLWFGVLLVPLTWQLARRLRLGDATAAVGALLMAISPFGLWYSQEVRMYTLGAALGLLCLLASAPFVLNDRPAGRLWRPALLLAMAGALGLYTLYYFAFLLVSINLLLIPLLLWRWRSDGKEALRPLAVWLAAQAGTLLLFAPWLPVAWRQATDPPVPPWRAAPQLGPSLAESWGALSFGQSAPLARFWPLLLLTLLLTALAVAAAWRGRTAGPPSSVGRPATGHHTQPGQWPAIVLLLTAAFGPPALILLASVATPLYHVRYLFTYAPAFSLLLAAGIVALAGWRPPAGRALAVAAALIILAGSALSLRAFWSDPALRADDHRAAVRELAARWRPGDAILVDAGYTYPVLLTYWPADALVDSVRLGNYTPADARRQDQVVQLVQAGHVDGDPELGWGDPRSDFYALSSGETRARLAELAATHPRIWLYRIYDTVNDPDGLIRQTLAASGALVDDRVYSGEASLRVQLWQTAGDAAALDPAGVFDGWLTLALPPAAAPDHVTGGDTLDVTGARWRRTADGLDRQAALSLRLVDENGEVWAAHDETLGGNQPPSGPSELVQPLRLAVPPGTPPGRYDLALVVYDPSTGQPLTLPDGATSLLLGQVNVTPTLAAGQRPLADFGPLRLLEAASPASAVSPGDEIPVELRWQAGPGVADEPLVVVVQLLDGQGSVAASLEQQPLGGRYPTTAWLEEYEVVGDRLRLRVPDETPPGVYQLIAGVYRAGDRERLTASSGLRGLRRADHAVIREIEVRPQ